MENFTDRMAEWAKGAGMDLSFIDRIVEMAPRSARDYVDRAEYADQIMVASRDEAPPEVLRQMARESSTEVRAHVARRADLPDDMVSMMARDRSPLIRLAIARRSRLPVGVAGRMATTDSA